MTTKKLNLITSIAVVISIIVLLCPDPIKNYTPVVFWLMTGLLMIIFVTNLLKMGKLIKLRDPVLFRQHSFMNWMLTNQALMDQDFLAQLTAEEKSFISNNKSLIKYFVICFILFALSGIVIAFV